MAGLSGISSNSKQQVAKKESALSIVQRQEVNQAKIKKQWVEKQERTKQMEENRLK